MNAHQNIKPRVAGALAALLLVGGSFAQWSPVGAQTIPIQTSGPRASAALDATFAVTLPTFQTFVDQHGGQRSLGLPLSNDFQLLGRRVQIFERGVLQQRTDGSVQVLDLLRDILPLAHADGATFPAADPDQVATNPALDNPTYQDQALAAIDSGRLDTAAPDDLDGIPVNFGATFRAAATCADLPTGPCDQRSMLRAALDVWGLPTSVPTADPNDPDLIYLRFQRGIMQFSQSTGITEAVPVGAWFKRVLIGVNVPDDLAADLVGSHYLAQYSPSMPLGLTRATELPASSLTAAFSAPATIITAGTGAGALGDVSTTPVLPGMPAFGQSTLAQQSPDPTAGGPSSMGSSGTPTPFGSASTSASQNGFGQTGSSGQNGFGPNGFGQTGLGQNSVGQNSVGQNSVGQNALGQNSVGQNSIGQNALGQNTVGQNAFGPTGLPQPAAAQPGPGTPGPVGAAGTSLATNPALPAAATPSTPLGPDPCSGDEQILFAPKKPYVGTDVYIAVTSSAHHDVRTVRLTGPVKTGPVSERAGLNGWVWEWTISPTVEGWYEFTFFADGERACATSGFNTLPAFGGTAVPSVTATPAFQTATPIPSTTATPTPTTVPAPSLAATGAADPPSGVCSGRILRLNGANFGATQSALNGSVLFSGGPGGAAQASIFNWTNNSIMVTVPTGLTAGTYQIFVTTSAGASGALSYSVGACA